jgi:hypothetical protein
MDTNGFNGKVHAAEGSSLAMSDLDDAKAAHTLSNAANTQTWQWAFTGGSQRGLILQNTGTPTTASNPGSYVLWVRSQPSGTGGSVGQGVIPLKVSSGNTSAFSWTWDGTPNYQRGGFLTANTTSGDAWITSNAYWAGGQWNKTNTTYWTSGISFINDYIGGNGLIGLHSGRNADDANLSARPIMVFDFRGGMSIAGVTAGSPIQGRAACVLASSVTNEDPPSYGVCDNVGMRTNDRWVGVLRHSKNNITYVVREGVAQFSSIASQQWTAGQYICVDSPSTGGGFTASSASCTPGMQAGIVTFTDTATTTTHFGVIARR